MKRRLKLLILLLTILLISLISFCGIYKKEKNTMESIVKEYLLGMDFAGYRNITLNVNTSSETKIYDKDGNLLETTDENEQNTENTVKEEPINAPEKLNVENYKKAKEIIENRLQQMGVVEYQIRFNETDGKIFIKMPDTLSTDMIQETLVTTGKFQLISKEDEKVLMENSDIKNAKVGYANTESGTTVFLNIEFTKEGSKKLDEISKTYTKSEDSEGNDTSKKINMKIDDGVIMETAFTEPISNGILQLSIGQASTSNSDIQNNLSQASRMACLLQTGDLPLIYETDENVYVASDIDDNMTKIAIIASIVVGLAFLIILTILFKKRGLLSGISLIGYLATLLLIIRYTNVILTIESIAGIVLMVLLNIGILIYFLRKQKNVKQADELKKNWIKISKKILWASIPTLIISVVLCFSRWLPVYSFGMILFWGWFVMLLYHESITRTIMINSIKE